MDEFLRVMNEAIAKQDHLEALKAALNAQRASGSKTCPHSLRSTIDRLAAACLLHLNSTAGYTGRVLTVRPPALGTEWLGGHAPPDTLLDDPVFYKTLSPHDQPTGALPWLSRPSPPASRGGGPLVFAPHDSSPAGVDSAAALADHMALSLNVHRPLGYRCLAHAIQAASDGDVIILMEGVHPSGSGKEEEGLVVEKRLLIKGQGKVVLEHRSNAPLLRLRRGGVVLQDLTVDMSGFRECIRCEEGEPVLLRCSLTSSGGDAIHVTGSSNPVLVDCMLQARHNGVQVWSSDSTRFSTTDRGTGRRHAGPSVTLQGCTISGCGGSACTGTGTSTVTLHACHINDVGQEGVVMSDKAKAILSQVHWTKCKGPAVDISGSSQVVMQRCSIEDCGGGAWLWDNSQLMVHGPGKIESHTAPAILLEHGIRAAHKLHGIHTKLRHSNTKSSHTSSGGSVLLTCGTMLHATTGIKTQGHARIRADVPGMLHVPMCPACEVSDGQVEVPAELLSVKVLGRVVLASV